MAFSQWLAGEPITAGKLALISPKWDDWTPVWTTSTGVNTPTFGSAGINARYCQTADLVMVKFEIAFAGDTAFGGGGASDNWQFSLPVEASTNHQVIGTAELNNGTTAARCIARMRCTDTTTFSLEVSSGRPDATAITALGLVDAASPWAWSTSGAIRGTALYEAA